MRFGPALFGLVLALSSSTALADGDRDYRRIVSAASLDFDDRGSAYPGRAVAEAEDCAFALHLYVVDEKRGRDRSSAPALIKRGLQAPGPVCGEASVAAGPKGALLLTILNASHPPFSKETLTIVYRDGEFLVSGFAFASSEIGGPESLEKPKRSSTCTIDFLTGRALRYGEAVKVGPAPRLSDWDGAYAAVCP